MKSFSPSIIPKFILLISLLSAGIIFLLFILQKQDATKANKVGLSDEKLFSQVIKKGMPEIIKIWEEGKGLFPNEKFNCAQEIKHSSQVGNSYYQCQPHFWQCYWERGVIKNPEVKVEYNGALFHLEVLPSFSPILEYSSRNRFYEIEKLISQEVTTKFAMKVNLKVKEIDHFTQMVVLFDTCRDVYLPQRIYPYGAKSSSKKEEWDNFLREIFVDKFYVSNEKVNQWRILTNQKNKLEKNRKKWPHPAILNLKEQNEYCSFWGKRILEAKIFDAASMTPGEMDNPRSTYILRPETFWARDIKKTFLGVSRENPEYELSSIDCDLVQVAGCKKTYFSTESSTWTGFQYSQGFYAESLVNTIHPKKNLKKSSFLLPAYSKYHELGMRTFWDGIIKKDFPIAFRCYEELE